MPEKPPTDARDREVARTAWVSTAAPSPELASLVAKLSPDNLSSTMQVLDELTELTMWKEENQRQLLVLGAPQLLIQLVRSRVKYATQPKDNTAQSSTADQDINAIVRALQVLMQVSTLDDLASLIVNIPGTVALLTELLSHPAVHISVSAARCLLNLTHSSQEAQTQALSVSPRSSTHTHHSRTNFCRPPSLKCAYSEGLVFVVPCVNRRLPSCQQP